MIVFIVIAGIALLSAVFLLMPDLPPVPEALISMQDSFNVLLHKVVQLFFYFLTPNLAFVGLIVISAIFVSEPIYHGIMWILRKVPVLGIK